MHPYINLLSLTVTHINQQSASSGNQDYSLGYFNLWWNRILGEALNKEVAKKKEKEDNINSLRMRRLLMKDAHTHTDQDSAQSLIPRELLFKKE
jgi:hypothetical protein